MKVLGVLRRDDQDSGLVRMTETSDVVHSRNGRIATSHAGKGPIGVNDKCVSVNREAATSRNNFATVIWLSDTSRQQVGLFGGTAAAREGSSSPRRRSAPTAA